MPQRTARSHAALTPATTAAAGPLPHGAVALSNNDVAFVSWSFQARIDGCLGFAVYRHDITARTVKPLPAWVGFKGETNDHWQAHTTEEWPIQKFSWKDLTARRGGVYQYEIVPMVGTPGKLTPQTDRALMTNPVHLDANRGAASAYFNRGILSTQSLRKEVPIGPGGAPNYKKLQDRIDQPGDPLRLRLTGDLCDAIKGFVDRASQRGGAVYAALYELSDTELEQKLLGSPFVHVILSNTGDSDDTNRSGRQALHESHTDVLDRMLPGGHIGHNKFLVYVDAAGKPQAVLSGSTNWTPPGLCGQSNNAIIIESPEVAEAYLDYWNRLKADTAAAENGGKLQDAKLRKDNQTPVDVDMGGHSVRIWFSPNTEKRTKPAKDADLPLDMEDVFNAIAGAKKAIFFLAFQPGTPSLVNAIAAAQKAKPSLIVRGAVTDPNAANQFYTDLYHRSGDKPDMTASDLHVVAASAIQDQFAFWAKELLKMGPHAHAIIHDKVIVIDPLSVDCVVITGSHNLGYRASYNNDENMLIIRGNRAVAEAYATHVQDVYEHYRFRASVERDGASAWDGLDRKDGWQDKYFTPGGKARSELDYWLTFVSPSAHTAGQPVG